MRITGVEINNYKSLGSSKNYLLIEPDITALIGKNESGKSNVLEAIGNMNFLTPMNKIFTQNTNRNQDQEVSIIFDLEFSPSELEKYNGLSTLFRTFC